MSVITENRYLSVVEAKQTIARHQTAAPVQLIPLAKEFGLEVYRVPNWPNDLSGMIRKDSEAGGPSGFAIYVNASHAPVRRRFTIAHEIAHFVLHRDKIGDGIVDDALYRSGLSSRQEAEANRLAADILMPWHLINDAMRNGYNTIDGLAKLFDVSKSAMSIRLGVPYESAA